MARWLLARVRKEELYDLFWLTPVSPLAKRFGLSDVGLKKVCRKHHNPTPPPDQKPRESTETELMSQAGHSDRSANATCTR